MRPRDIPDSDVVENALQELRAGPVLGDENKVRLVDRAGWKGYVLLAIQRSVPEELNASLGTVECDRHCGGEMARGA